MIVNLAQRAHNHNYETDPCVRSLLDTDFYKLLMLQFVWQHYPQTRVRFALLNRTKSVRLAEIVDEGELRRQLDAVRALRFRRSELVWLAGNSFYGQRNIFSPAFIEWLEGFALPEYRLSVVDGQYELHFEGRWLEVMMWEIYALSVVNELKTRAALKRLSEFELDILYARAKAKLWGKIERLSAVEGVRFADFGTRRRHSFLWQEYVIQAFDAKLDGAFAGTSNAYLAFKHDLEAIGTNAHELPMVMAALAGNDAALKASQYDVLRLWQQTYQRALLVMLPDTFGTTQFLRDAPEWVADWTGLRIDSKDPIVAGEEYIAWLEARGRDPRTKLIIPSDGLDVEDIVALHRHFHGRIRISHGWGTLATNDFRGCDPTGGHGFDPLSLVCKVQAVEVDGRWRSAVKLSDNVTKATGAPDEVERYRRVFGSAGMAGAPVIV